MNGYEIIEEIMGEMVNDLNERVKETVTNAYNMGFTTGCKSFKRYAVNVVWFDDDDMARKDIFKRFATLEDVKAYIERIPAYRCSTFVYEYNYVNEQYESMEI